MSGGVPRRRAWLGADRALELAFVGVVVTGGLGLLAALLGIFEAPQIWLLGLLVTGVYGTYTHRRPLQQTVDMRWTHVGLLILVVLFFRLPAFHYVLGGQDQGVYVNIASHLERTGQLEVTDRIVDRLQEGPALSQYLQSNRSPDGSYLAGIYAAKTDNSKLEFQFYHLFPVWMALVSGVFGASASVYALTLFAILSIMFAYRLVLTVTGQGQAALWAALLLAANPLHAFFSKFPVTEVPALACSLAGFSYIANYWQSPSVQRSRRMLVIAFVAFTSIFFFRISGFMYVPFLVALACLIALRDEDRQRRAAMQWLIVAIALAYGLSVIYGLTWAQRYSTDIYNAALGSVLGPAWASYVAVVIALGLSCWLACSLVPFDSAWRQRSQDLLINPLRVMLGFMILAVIALSVLKIYWLGWTEHYAAAPRFNGPWNFSGSSWRAAKASSFAQLGLYMGPLLLGAGLWLLCWRQRDPMREFLRLFTAGFLAYMLVLQWNLPYGPYYARYLLSEVLPYLLLFVVCVWAASKRGYPRHLLTAVLVISSLYAVALSVGQLGKQENAGLYDSLARLVVHVDPDDVLLLDSMGPGLPHTSELKTPLVFVFDKNVVTVSKDNLADPAYLQAIAQRFDDTHLLSPHSKAPPGFEASDSARITVWAFRHGFGPPLQLGPRENMRLHLFRKIRSRLPLGVEQTFQSGADTVDWLDSGWSTPESWGVWSDSEAAILAIDTSALPRSPSGIQLHITARAYISPNHPRQRVQVVVDGRDVQSLVAVYPDAGLSFNVPISAERLRSGGTLQVHFNFLDPASPKSLGASGDARELSIGLLSVRADPLPPVQ